MTKEEAIRALEVCTEQEGCKGCPLWLSLDDISCQTELMTCVKEMLQGDALLLSVDDVTKWDGAVWLEFKVISGIQADAGTWAFFVAEQRPNFNFQLQRDLQSLTRLPIDTYGYYWRCWSKRPTDKQREEHAWQ